MPVISVLFTLFKADKPQGWSVLTLTLCIEYFKMNLVQRWVRLHEPNVHKTGVFVQIIVKSTHIKEK